MNQAPTLIKRALISVSDKTGIAEFARALAELNIDIISTGGTSQLLRKENIPVQDVTDVTQFPEMMDGRVKTLHPKIHGGILGQRDHHAEIANAHHIQWIDLVVVNLYPFAKTIKKPNVIFDEAIENIDIGGPAMIRSAAKNMEWVTVVVDPNDYSLILNELRKKSKKSEKNSIDFSLRRSLAMKAFAHTAQYDALIHRYLEQRDFPEEINLNLKKTATLRYGENPHQAACAYQFDDDIASVLSAKQHQGKQLSYNNIADADAAFACVQEFELPACVIVKHANPCGVSMAKNINEAFQNAFEADTVSAFGGIVALNQPCTQQVAAAIANVFIEVVIAPSYTAEALTILANKPNLRVLEMNDEQKKSCHEYKFIDGGFLIQEKDTSVIQKADLKIVTKLKPTEDEIATMLFAWPVLKYIKSNAILIAKKNTTVGIGAGQVSRVDAVDIALKKAGKNSAGAILASDAFFPFRDSIDRLLDAGIRAIIQPGGSMRDEEVIAACDEHKIAMVLTGKRCFKH